MFVSPFHLPLCVSVTPDCGLTAGMTGSDSGGGMILASDWLSEVVLLSTSVVSKRQYFVSKSPARWFSPTLLLLRATARIFHEGLTLVFNHVFSISVSCSWGLWNIALIVSSSPALKLSWSPSGYHFADTSTTSSSTHGRSAGVNLLSEQDNSRELI